MLTLAPSAAIAADSNADGLHLEPTSVEGWFELRLRNDGTDALLQTFTFNETGLTGVHFHSVTSPVVYSTSDIPPALPESHLTILA